MPNLTAVPEQYTDSNSDYFDKQKRLKITHTVTFSLIIYDIFPVYTAAAALSAGSPAR